MSFENSVYATKAYGGGGIAPLILQPRQYMGWMFRITVRPLYSQTEWRQELPEAGWVSRLSGRSGKRKKWSPLPRNEPRFTDCPVRSLVTILNTLFPFNYYIPFPVIDDTVTERGIHFRLANLTEHDRSAKQGAGVHSTLFPHREPRSSSHWQTATWFPHCPCCCNKRLLEVTGAWQPTRYVFLWRIPFCAAQLDHLCFGHGQLWTQTSGHRGKHCLNFTK